MRVVEGRELDAEELDGGSSPDVHAVNQPFETIVVSHFHSDARESSHPADKQAAFPLQPRLISCAEQRYRLPLPMEKIQTGAPAVGRFEKMRSARFRINLDSETANVSLDAHLVLA